MLSVIVINCVFDVILLELSSACHITAVWPEGKIYPSGILFVIVGKAVSVGRETAEKSRESDEYLCVWTDFLSI